LDTLTGLKQRHFLRMEAVWNAYGTHMGVFGFWGPSETAASGMRRSSASPARHGNFGEVIEASRPDLTQGPASQWARSSLHHRI
jgi:hypothetical protein